MGTESGVTAELYKTIVTIVDERVKEIKVTRENFNELRDAMEKLTKAQAKTEERVGRLEDAVEKLTKAQTKTEERVGRLEDAVEKLTKAQAKTEERLERLEDAVEKLAKAQAKTEERVGRLEDAVEKLAKAQAKTEERVKELAAAQAKTEEKLGILTAAFEGLKTEVKSLSDTVGLGLEDLGSAVLPSYIERTYGISAVTFSRKFITIDGKGIEINLYAEGKRDGETIILLGEAKNRIRKAEVSKYIKRITALKDYLDKPLFLFMFGYWIHPSAEELAKDNGIELIVTYKLTR